MLRLARLDQRRTGPVCAAPLMGQGWTWVGAIRFATRAVLCVVLGALLGLIVTEQAVRREGVPGAVQIGAWSFSPDAGTADINPYLRARFARSGQIPMATAQGVLFLATRDDSGAKLDRSCVYTVSGTVPAARYWTIEAADKDGFPLANAAQRSGFSSQELLRDAEGRFTIAVSAEPRPGNWLPLTGTGRLVLVLRLYDTAIAALGTKSLRELPVPSITADRCG